VAALYIFPQGFSKGFFPAQQGAFPPRFCLLQAPVGPACDSIEPSAQEEQGGKADEKARAA